jgi:hypothetical protein
MTKAAIYNTSLLGGTTMIGAGIGMINIPAALVVVGALVIAMTFAVAYLSRKG